MGLSVQRHMPTALPPAKRLGTHFAGVWWRHTISLEEYEKSRPPPPHPPEIRSLDRPARIESLYRLRNPGLHCIKKNVYKYL
jgi:hypothetical protein